MRTSMTFLVHSYLNSKRLLTYQDNSFAVFLSNQYNYGSTYKLVVQDIRIHFVKLLYVRFDMNRQYIQYIGEICILVLYISQ